MSKNKSKQATSNGSTAPAQPEDERSAEVSGSASAQAEDVREERPAEEEGQRLIAVAA